MICVSILTLMNAGCTNKDREQMNVLNISYNSNINEWKKFLTCWEAEILGRIKLEKNRVESEEQVLKNNGIKSAGASDKDIQLLEKKLRTTLPKSVVDFLRASNGILVPYDDTHVYGSKSIDYFVKLKPRIARDWMSGYELPIKHDKNYFDYKNQLQLNTMPRFIELDKMLMISDVFDGGVYLLNPEVKTKNDEWEAWILSWDLPGAYRFPSFAHMVINIYYWSEIQPMYAEIYDSKKLTGTCVDFLNVEHL